MLLPGCPCCGSTCECNIWDAAVAGSHYSDATSWLASQFLMGGTAQTITAVQLKSPSWAGLAPQNAEVSIWSNLVEMGGHVPDELLHTLTPPAVFTADPVFTTAGFTAAAGIRYWVVLRYNGGIWSWTDHNECIDDTQPLCQIRWADGVNSGAYWVPGFGSPYAFRLTFA